MKRKDVVIPSNKANNLQAVIDFLADNGMSEFDINQFIHLNLPALGEYTSIMDCVREDKWDDVWRVSQQFINGDYF